MSKNKKRNRNTAPVPPVPPELAQRADSSLGPVAEGILGSAEPENAALKLKAETGSTQDDVPAQCMMTVSLVRFYMSDSAYFADGDDGKTWRFVEAGETWNAKNDMPRPDDCVGVSAQEWEAADLPLTLDMPAPVEADVDVRNPVEAPRDMSAPPDDVPPLPDTLPDSIVLAKESGYKRVGKAVPFVVVPCCLVVPVIRVRNTAGKASVRYIHEEEARDEKQMENVDDKVETVTSKTKRVIEAVEEFRAADSMRQRSRKAILDLCKDTVIGWLCPRDREPQLRDKIVEVQQEIRAFNDGTVMHKVSDGCIVATIETDAAVAAATVREALLDALTNLREAFAAGDTETMRSIASGLKGFDALVNVEAAQKVEEAITEARKIARTIVRETEKKGREMADVIAELSTDAIDAARFMLIAQEGAVKADDGEALPEVDGRTLEVAPMVEPPAFDGAEDDVTPDTDENESEVNTVAAQNAGDGDEMVF